MTRLNENSRSLRRLQTSERVHDRMVKDNKRKLDLLVAGTDIDLNQLKELVDNYTELDTTQQTHFTGRCDTIQADVNQNEQDGDDDRG